MVRFIKWGILVWGQNKVLVATTNFVVALLTMCKLHAQIAKLDKCLLYSVEEY